MEAPPKEPRKRRPVGLCNYTDRLIYVTPGPQQDTILRHETIHAQCPWMNEAEVEALETALYESDMQIRHLGCP